MRNENDAICLYIPATARILSFSHPKYGAVRDWTIPQTLLPGYCYSLRLKIRQTPEHAAAGLPDRIPTPGPVPKPVSATTQRVKPEISTRIRRESQFSDHFIDFTGGACPKNAPSGASTPSRVAQKADRALNCGLFGQPGGGGWESVILAVLSAEGPCSGYRTIHDFMVQRGKSPLWISNHPRFHGSAWKVTARKPSQSGRSEPTAELAQPALSSRRAYIPAALTPDQPCSHFVAAQYLSIHDIRLKC